METRKVSEVHVYSVAEIRWWIVAAVIAKQLWPLLGFIAVLQVVALGWYIRSDDHMSLSLALACAEATFIGLAGSFCLHECAHVAILRRLSGISHIAVERSWLRISVQPTGWISPRQIACVALAGPMVCVLFGLVIFCAGRPHLSVWFLMHGAYLLPPFGDGRTLIQAWRQRTHSRLQV